MPFLGKYHLFGEHGLWKVGTFSLKAVVAECMATCLFVYIGTGTATTFSATQGFNLRDPIAQGGVDTGDAIQNINKITDNLLTNGSWGVTTALAFGYAITVLAYATGHLSGGQMNPAVTIALFLGGSLGFLQMVGNVCAQMAGALLGSGLLYATIPQSSSSTLGANQLQPGVAIGHALCGEIVMTFVLVSVVLEVAGNNNSTVRAQAPLAIGFAVFCAHAVLLPIDGCSINPARSFGPAAVAGQWDGGKFWIFVVGPLAGAIVAVPFHLFFSSHWDTTPSNDPIAIDPKDNSSGNNNDKKEEDTSLVNLGEPRTRVRPKSKERAGQVVPAAEASTV